ncbi:MAG: PAS domain-containing protein [Eudoraea sp.]|nr:PAS domain-containing protein [Eudoraea sp.]
MKEFKNFDKAASSFYKSTQAKVLPILSWDISGSYFDKTCKDFDDLRVLKTLAQSNRWSYKNTFDEDFLDKEQVIVVTDPELKIVYATNNIYKMNGYTLDEIKDKTPKIFQGQKTDSKTNATISKAIKNQEPFEAIVVNYRKDGSTYNCWIKGEPIFNKKGKIVNFIAYEREVA